MHDEMNERMMAKVNEIILQKITGVGFCCPEIYLAVDIG